MGTTTAILICPDLMLAQELQSVASTLPGLMVARVVEHYPESGELTRIIRAVDPRVLFIGTESFTPVSNMVAHLEKTVPHLPVVVFARHPEPTLLIELMRLGVREYLPYPFTHAGVCEVLERVRERLEARPFIQDASDQLYAFLPAKAGVGASTLAVNSAVALGRSCSVTTLLTDFDLNSGMVRFMLKLSNERSLLEALERAGELDEDLWKQLITPVGKLHVLHAGPMNPHFRVEQLELRQMLSYARRHYEAIVADLSGNLERYSVDVMHEAKKIFLVCTPEIASLHLAVEKLRFLQRLDLGSKVHLLLNRAHKRAILSRAEIEGLLGREVTMSFPNDYPVVHQSLTLGQAVPATNPLGKQCGELARLMAQHDAVSLPESGKKSLLQYFSGAARRSAPEVKYLSARSGREG